MFTQTDFDVICNVLANSELSNPQYERLKDLLLSMKAHLITEARMGNKNAALLVDKIERPTWLKEVV